MNSETGPKGAGINRRRLLQTGTAGITLMMSDVSACGSK